MDNWWLKGAEEYWKHITNNVFTFYKNRPLDHTTLEHIAVLELAAHSKTGLKGNNSQNRITNKAKMMLGWIKVKKGFSTKSR